MRALRFGLVLAITGLFVPLICLPLADNYRRNAGLIFNIQSMSVPITRDKREPDFRVVETLEHEQHIILVEYETTKLAVRLTEWLRHKKQLSAQRDGIFRTLMATRNATLAPAHVEALNLVDVLFHNGKPQDRRVVDAWRLYLSHLNDHQYPKESWAARRSELLVELLYEMGIAVGYSFDKSQIKAGAYYPGGELRIVWSSAFRRPGALSSPVNAYPCALPPKGGTPNLTDALNRTRLKTANGGSARSGVRGGLDRSFRSHADDIRLRGTAN